MSLDCLTALCSLRLKLLYKCGSHISEIIMLFLGMPLFASSKEACICKPVGYNGLGIPRNNLDLFVYDAYVPGNEKLISQWCALLLTLSSVALSDWPALVHRRHGPGHFEPVCGLGGYLRGVQSYHRYQLGGRLVSSGWTQTTRRQRSIRQLTLDHVIPALRTQISALP